MAEDLKSTESSLGKMAGHMHEFDTSATHASVSVAQLIKAVVFGENALKAWGIAANRTPLLKGIDTALTTVRQSTSELLDNFMSLEDRIREIEAFRMGGPNAKGVSLENAESELHIAAQQLELAKSQLRLDTVINDSNKVALAIYGLVYKSAAALYAKTQEINHALISANSSMVERASLARAILDNQRQLGTSTQTAVEAARALVEYGHDYNDVFESNLKLVVELHDGLGMSIHQSAELATIYENQLHVSATGVADEITRVVNETHLAANEAGRMAANLGRAFATFNPGIAKDLNGVNELVGRYEGAMNKLGGQVGDFNGLLARLSTPEGILQAGLLGVNDPAQIASREGARQIFDSFAAYAKNTLGSSSGWDRALKLQSLSELFGINAQQINLMVRAIDDSNNQVKSTITLQERYEEQLSDSFQAIQRLKTAVGAFLQSAAIPLLRIVSFIAAPIADFIKCLANIPGAVEVVGAAFVLAGAFLVRRLIKVGIAFMDVAASAMVATRALNARAVADGLIGAGGTAGFLSVLSKWVSALPYMLALPIEGAIANVMGAVGFAATIGAALIPLGAIIAAALTGAFAGVLFNSAMEKLAKIQLGLKANYRPTELKETSKEFFNRMLQIQAAHGDIEGIKETARRAREKYLKEGMSTAAMNATLARQLRGLPEIIGNAKFATYASGSLYGLSAHDKMRAERQDKAQAESLRMADGHRNAALMLQADSNEAANNLATSISRADSVRTSHTRSDAALVQRAHPSTSTVENLRFSRPGTPGYAREEAKDNKHLEELNTAQYELIDIADQQRQMAKESQIIERERLRLERERFAKEQDDILMNQGAQ